ncbi:MAG: Polysaccharide biosynthesis protein [Chlamydiia bacterium]|nr:Polysaccharide biosynthesis protein [Chlamydiia bacterium]
MSRLYDITKIIDHAPQSFFPCMLAVAPYLVNEQVVQLIEQLRQVQHVDGIVVISALDTIDDEVAKFCDAHSLHSVRSDDPDLLARLYEAAESFDLEVLVFIKDLSIKAELIDRALFCFRKSYDELDYFSDQEGKKLEIFRVDLLKDAFYHAKKRDERRDLSHYIQSNPAKFRIGFF